LTKTCSYCKRTDNDIKVLMKDYTRKNGSIINRCRRCDTLLVLIRKDKTQATIVGEHRSLREKPKALKTCDCCGHKAHTFSKLQEDFRRFRNNKKPSSFVAICKLCENTATMVLSELQYIAREGGSMPRGSKAYHELLTTLFSLNGFKETPLNSWGEPVDLMAYQMNFCMLNGRPLATSAVSIRQIKINAGYMPKEENRSNECKK